jgi:hypothetical protein
MPRYVDSLSVLEKPRRAVDVVSILRSVLIKHGTDFSPHANVIFNDWQGREREPEVALSEEEAIKAILSWPALGGTEYNFSGHKLIVFLFATEAYCVDAISLSIISGNRMDDPKVKSDHEELIKDIHISLAAKRSLVEYELLSPNSFWIQEVERIRSGVFEGKYFMDLR